MRIPTEPGHGSGFRTSGRSRGAVATERGAVRRLIRLVIALVLVIVVMDAAGNPAIYRPFFADQQPVIQPRTPLSREGGTPAADSQDDFVEGSAVSVPEPATLDFTRQWVQGLGEQQRTTLTHLLAWKRQQNESARQRLLASAENLRARIDQIVRSAESLQIASENAAKHAALSDAYSELLPSLIATALAENGDDDETRGDAVAIRSGPDAAPPRWNRQQAVLLEALQVALDETYQRRVVDGAVWSAGDADAFYRYLERSAEPDFLAADAPPDSRPVQVGVVPLLQQSEVYQGQMVAIGGTVARATQRQAKENPFGIVQYWEVWLRPTDGTERPVILYATEVSEAIAKVGPDAALQQGPEVQAVGIFLKRRLFNAVGGPEQAPVIIGRAVGATAPPTLQPAAPDAADAPSVQALVAIAALVGVGFAAWLMWRTAVSAKRSRQLRRKGERGTLPSWQEVDLSSSHANSDQPPKPMG